MQPQKNYPRTRKEQRVLEHIQAVADKMDSRQFAEMYVEAMHNSVLRKDELLLSFIDEFERPPVGIEEFLDSTEFLGATDITIWPEVRKTLIDINKNWWRGIQHGAYDELILCGATGTAKTTIAIITSLYVLYILSCMINPQRWYSLPKTTSVVIAILAAKPHVMKKVFYLPMRKTVEAMPYFQKYMMPDRLIESEMYFPEKNIRVVPAGGDEDAVLGEAVIHSIIDEINFMNVVLRSKKAEVTSGRAGLYDQAVQVHSTLSRRKKGRFTRPGPMIGMTIAASSTRYKGDFTDKRREQVKKDNVKHCYVYNRKQYDVVPADRFSGVKFRLLIANDMQHDTRVLRDDEPIPEGAHIEEVPIEYLTEFQANPYDALRDIMGMANNVISPFIKSRYKIYECVEEGKERGLTSFLLKDHVILGLDGMPQVKQGHFCANPSKPRFVHIDLSRNGDRCGIAMVKFEGMMMVQRKEGQRELLPCASLEMACSIEPDANNEIDIAEIRNFVRILKERHRYPIKSVSYDGFDSRESIQVWRKLGMPTRVISVDRYEAQYKQFRDALYDCRIWLLDDEVLLDEIINLEYDADKEKIDHPVHGKKDVSDAVCAAFVNMLERKSTWAGGGIDSENPDGRAGDEGRFDDVRR